EIEYTISKPDRPLECIAFVPRNILNGRLGRTPRGLAFEIGDWQEVEHPEEVVEKLHRIVLTYEEVQLVEEWDGDLEGLTAIQLREQGKQTPILDSTARFIDHLRQFRESLAEAAVRRYEASEQWM